MIFELDYFNSMKKTMWDASEWLRVTYPTIYQETLYFHAKQYDAMRGQHGPDTKNSKKCFVVWSLGKSDPFAKHWFKLERGITIHIMARGFSDVEDLVVQKSLERIFRKGLNWQIWDSHDSDDIGDWTVKTNTVVEDVLFEQGYNGDDARYVTPMTINLKSPDT